MQESYENQKWLRPIDANLNRAAEAIRVIEDCLRFVIEDRHLTRICKRFRHELASWARTYANQTGLVARDSAGDVGREESVAREYHRSSIGEILKANFSRAQQSLRSIEEFAKLIGPDASKPIEQIRYEVYGVEKSVLVTYSSLERLAGVRLYVLLDGCESSDEFESSVTELIRGGVHAIQLRDKQLDDLHLVSRGETLVEQCKNASVVSIINDRVDIAMACGADGVHLGQEDLTVAQARKLAGPQMLVGVSTHSIEQARKAVLDGANYIGVGPTFPSTTKSFDEFAGTGLLNEVASEISLPAFAIGGIQLSSLDNVLQTGIGRVVVGNDVRQDGMVDAQRVRRFVQALDTDAPVTCKCTC